MVDGITSGNSATSKWQRNSRACRITRLEWLPYGMAAWFGATRMASGVGYCYSQDSDGAGVDRVQSADICCHSSGLRRGKVLKIEMASCISQDNFRSSLSIVFQLGKIVPHFLANNYLVPAPASVHSLKAKHICQCWEKDLCRKGEIY
jgi:hypothetical protein